MNDGKYKTWMRAARRKSSKLFGKRLLLWFFFAGQKMPPPPPPIERLPGKVGTKVAKGGVWWIRWLADNDSSSTAAIRHGGGAKKYLQIKIGEIIIGGRQKKRGRNWRRANTGKKVFCASGFLLLLLPAAAVIAISIASLSLFLFYPFRYLSSLNYYFALFYFCQMQVCERRKTRKGKKPSVFFAFTVKSGILIIGN